jgi:hypothetical protein
MLADAQKGAETKEALGKGAEASANAAYTELKTKGANVAPADIHGAVSSVVPANWADKTLAPRTEARMNFALQSISDPDKRQQELQSALGDASKEVGDIGKETNPAALQARATTASLVAQQVEPLRMQIMQTFGNQKDARDKIETTVLKPYEDKMSQIGELQSAIDQASQGNIAAARAALYKTIGVAQPAGSHRVLPAEIEGFGGMGPYSERIKGSIANALSGDPWTPQMVHDIKAFAQAQGQVAHDNLGRGIDSTNKLYGTQVGGGLKAQQAAPPASSTGQTSGSKASKWGVPFQ